MRRVLSLLITTAIANVLAAADRVSPPLEEWLYKVPQRPAVELKQRDTSPLEQFLYGPSPPTNRPAERQAPKDLPQATVYTLPIPQLLVDLARQEDLPLEQFIQADGHCEAVTSNADRTLFYVRCARIPSRMVVPGFGVFPLPLPQAAGNGMQFTLPIQEGSNYWLSGKRIGPGQLSLPVEAIGKPLCFTKDRMAKSCIERTITLRAILEQKPLHLGDGS